MPKKPKIKQPEDKYVDVLEDLCDTCSNAFKGGCPVWPTLNLTRYCVMYKRRGK
jgi:hypothetical protein